MVVANSNNVESEGRRGDSQPLRVASRARNGNGVVSREQQVASLVAGGLAGTLSSTVTCPLEVVKSKLQSSGIAGAKMTSVRVVARRIFDSEGIRGFFRGLLPTLVGILPARATYFWGYATTKQQLIPRFGENSLVHIASAAVAGIVSNTITNPIWVLKTRLQLEAGESSRLYTGYGQACIRVFREEGIRGFFRGLSASYWGVTEGAIHFLIYERLKKLLEGRNELSGKTEPGKLTPLQYLSSAATSKMVASALTYPHEVVRTRMREVPLPNQLPKYRTMVQSLRTIAREEGRRGLYAGMGTHLARVVPNAALMFMVYETVMRWMEKREQERRK